uniref:Zinc finger PHD-type domain-containing protein n=1 Tax=Amphimedon queenslandica TaxID=400682 RepID=A0A1X7T0S5_AMPQE
MPADKDHKSATSGIRRSIDGASPGSGIHSKSLLKKPLAEGTTSVVKCVCSSREDSGKMVQCEMCTHWLHCKCLHLTVSVASTYPLVCPHCVNGMCLKIKSLSDDVVQLHSVVTEQCQTIDSLRASMSGISEGKGSFDADIARLKEDLKSLKVSLPSVSSSNPGSPPSHGPVNVSPTVNSCPPGTGSNDSSERKYNIVVFGASECARGSAQPDHDSHDLNIITELFQGLSSSFDPQSVRDLHRLGKYQSDSDRRRPILVKLVRSVDAQLLLSKASDVSSPFCIQPDLSAHESTVRSVLLKERRSLIRSGTEKRH